MSIETRLWTTYDDAAPAVRPYLAQLTVNPFLNYAWLSEYEARTGENRRLLLVGFYRGERLVAFAPLALQRLPVGVTVARFAAQGRADYLGIAGEVSAEVINALMAALQSVARNVVLSLSDIPDDDPLSRLLESKLGAQPIPLYPCPYRDLTPNALPDSKSNKKFQSRIPGYLRRLETLGAVRLLTLDFDQSRQESLEWLPSLWALHDLRHAGRRNSWKSPANRAFLQSFLENSPRTGFLGFVTLLDGLPVAFDLGFRSGKAFHLYIPAFHPALEKYRLGHINRWLTFRACRDLGIETYDFSRGDSFAKRVWATGVRESRLFIAAVSDTAPALAAAAALTSVEKMKVWGRTHGVNDRLGRMQAFLSPKPAHPRSGQPFDATRDARPLLFRLIADLPLHAQTGIAEFAFAQGKSSCVEMTWTSPRDLVVRGTDPLAELAITFPAPRQSTSPALPATNEG